MILPGSGRMCTRLHTVPAQTRYRRRQNDPGDPTVPGIIVCGAQADLAAPKGLPIGTTEVPRMPLITPAADVYQAAIAVTTPM